MKIGMGIIGWKKRMKGERKWGGEGEESGDRLKWGGTAVLVYDVAVDDERKREEEEERDVIEVDEVVAESKKVEDHTAVAAAAVDTVVAQTSLVDQVEVDPDPS